MDTAQNEKFIKEFRPWGYYMVTCEGCGYSTKILHVNAGQELSVQSHNHRSEHWTVVLGEASVLLDGKEYVLNKGESIDIPLKAIHSLRNYGKEDLEVVEVQMGDILSEDDIVRYKDIYGRV